MAESGMIIAPNVLKERLSTPTRDWSKYLIAGPGERVTEPVSTTISGAGGLVFGFIVALALIGTPFVWVGIAMIVLGIPLGVLYAKVTERLSHNGRMIARGRGVRLLGGPHVNEAIVNAAKRDAPGYFELAKLAAQLDERRELIRKLEKDRAGAQLTVRREELARGERALRLLIATDSLQRATALLSPSDSAIDAAGTFTKVVYGEIEEGCAHIFDADH